MRTAVRLAAGGAAATLLGLLLLPLLVAAALSGHLPQASQLAGQWDIPPQLVAVFQEAAQPAGIPWFVLAGMASVATDFGRHGPDGLARGDSAGTSIFPLLVPPLVLPRGGSGMFLVDANRTVGGPTDLQDVRAVAAWLAQQSAARAGPAGQPGLGRPSAGPLSDPRTAPSWVSVIASLPLRVQTVALRAGDSAQTGGTDATPADPGSNPIRRFAGQLLARLGAPVTSSNLDAVDAWAAGEGSCARYNPLDTTQPEPGATPFNTLKGGGHVWNYLSSSEGVQATADTLQNGLYGSILAALRTSAGMTRLASAVAGSPWGTAGFGRPTYAGARCPGLPSSPAAPPIPPPEAAPPGADGIAIAMVTRAVLYASLWAQSAGRPAITGYALPVDRAWYQAHPDWFQRPHHDFPAVDIPVPTGTAAYAVTDGDIVAADEAAGATSCGHGVRLRGDDGALYTYCHGSQVLVTVGQRVGPGALLLRSGWSGAVAPAGPAGAHLHFQINLPGTPGPVCPQPALAAWADGRTYDPRQLPRTGCTGGQLR